MRPTLDTDAYEDGATRHVPIIFLAGPIKHWWSCWGSPEHEAYVEHRDGVRGALIQAGYLTYAAWDAIKGTWTERAQIINDAAIVTSDLMVVLTPVGIPADGTAAEERKAIDVDVPLLYIPPGVIWTTLMDSVESIVGPGVQYA